MLCVLGVGQHQEVALYTEHSQHAMLEGFPPPQELSLQIDRGEGEKRGLGALCVPLAMWGRVPTGHGAGAALGSAAPSLALEEAGGTAKLCSAGLLTDFFLPFVRVVF